MIYHTISLPHAYYQYVGLWIFLLLIAPWQLVKDHPQNQPQDLVITSKNRYAVAIYTFHHTTRFKVKMLSDSFIQHAMLRLS